MILSYFLFAGQNRTTTREYKYEQNKQYRTQNLDCKKINIFRIFSYFD